MSKEQAKEFFEAISKDKQLAAEVKEVLGEQATDQEKAKELLSFAKAHNFNFTEDELKTSLSIDDLADVAGGSGLGQAMAGLALSTMQVLGVGGNGGQQPLPGPNPVVNVQQVGNGEAQNKGEQLEDEENEVPQVNVDEEVDVVRAPTLGELLERLEREGQVQHNHELEEMIAQALHELDGDEIDRDGDPQDLFNLSKRVFSKVTGAEELVQRLERLERIYPRVRTSFIARRIGGFKLNFFKNEIEKWLELICDPSKNVDVSLQDLIAEADFFIEQATEAVRSRLKAILPGIRHLSDRMSKAKIGRDLQQQIVGFCENANAIASGDNVTLEELQELQELLEMAYMLGDEATAIINSHFAPAPKPETADEENEVEEIRELTPEEIAERRQRAEQRRRELEERLAQGPLELTEPNYFENDETNRLFREIDDTELLNRINRLNTLYYRLLYAPQSQDLMDRIRNYIATANDTLPSGTASLQEQISIADVLILEAEEMLQRAEQQRGEEIREEELRAEIQHGLDTLALILRRTHTGLPGETDLYTDVQTFLANRESYSREERIARAKELLDRTLAFHSTLDLEDPLRLGKAYDRFASSVFSWEGDKQAVLEERLENNALPWITQIRDVSGVQRDFSGISGEHELALEIQEFFNSLKDDFTDEHLVEMNSLIDRARELIMNRAHAHSRFDLDQSSIRNNDLQLAQMLGIDKEYIQEKIKNKIKMSANDITGTIELPDGDTVTFNFMVGSGTLVLTGSGNTVIGDRFDNDSLFKQLEEAGIVFAVKGADGYLTSEQLPTRDYPFVVRNLIIGNGITKIDQYAFAFAQSLRSLYLMGPVRFVGFHAFCHSCHLMEVGFAQPKVLERIERDAFSDNYNLVSINIPQNADIAENAFEYCERLKEQGCPYC